MSIETRMAVAYNRHLIFQRQSQRSDLIDPTMTQTYLIAFLDHLLAQGWILEVTAVRSDHANDEGLGLSGYPWCGTHAHGWAVDLWPLNSVKAGDYMEASDPHFQKFLSQAMNAPFYMQTGLAGEADTPINHVAAGRMSFTDGGASHVHLGVRNH